MSGDEFLDLPSFREGVYDTVRHVEFKHDGIELFEGFKFPDEEDVPGPREDHDVKECPDVDTHGGGFSGRSFHRSHGITEV
jgi:hypothetical protein